MTIPLIVLIIILAIVLGVTVHVGFFGLLLIAVLLLVLL